MARYVELECQNPGCESTEVWEAYVRFEDDGDGGADMIPLSDGPGLMSSLDCLDCGHEGERI